MSDRATVLRASLRSFERQVIHAELPVLVDFWATWCPPCRMQASELESAAGQLSGRARIASVNVDDEPELAGAYGVRSIPALMVFKDGDVVESWVGFTPAASIVQRLSAHIGH